MPQLPSGTVTFLFTDIEGSTRRWEEQPDAMQVALARHDEILDDAISNCGGVVFSRMGDGMAGAFASPGAALAAAVDAQLALAAHSWGATGQLRVRMGIHTGDGVLVDGQYLNQPLNRCARLMAVGHGGQVLVSSVAAELVGDHLPEGCELVDLGERHLRDLARPMRVFQLVVPGLGCEFPPLRSLDAIPTNLPAELTSFVGRAADLVEVANAVRKCRFVTITGVGGVGKTRLALQIAADLAVEYPDGAWLCELASAQDGDALLEVVAVALGVAPRAGLTRAESIIEQLRRKSLVVIIDNCEHLLDESADLIDRLLGQCAGVRVLATSREGLGIRGEQLWPLRSFVVPNDEVPLEVLRQCDAVTLFTDRAVAADPRFLVDERNGRAVAEICRRLDGIPLAIELAAAHVAAMSPRDIAELLDERFRLLTGGRRRAVERHQTLRSAVEWSYSLLSESERDVFDRLGLFVGSFDAAAVQAVVAGAAVDRFAVLDALEELVAKSMLSADRADDGTTRYQLLETLRHFALDKLEAYADIDELRRLHARHYAQLAATLGPQLRSDQEVSARCRTLLELDNVRSAIGWALERDDPSDQLLAVQTIAYFGTVVSTMRSTAFGDWAERAAPVALSAPAGLRFSALGAAAFAATTRGDTDAARALTDAAFSHGVPDDAPEYSMAFIGRCVAQSGDDMMEASHGLADNIARVAELGDGYGAVAMRSVLGIFAWLGGDQDRGRHEAATAVAEARQLGNPTTLSVALYGDAIVRWQDDPRGALLAIEECLSVIASGASDVIHADVLELRARIESSLGDLRQALETMRAGLAESIAVSNRPSVLSSQWYLAEILGLAKQQLEVAATLSGFTERGPLASSFPAVAGAEAALHDRAITALRNALGEEKYEAAANHGARMTYDDAVAYTVAELDQILGDG